MRSLSTFLCPLAGGKNGVGARLSPFKQQRKKSSVFSMAITHLQWHEQRKTSKRTSNLLPQVARSSQFNRWPLLNVVVWKRSPTTADFAFIVQIIHFILCMQSIQSIARNLSLLTGRKIHMKEKEAVWALISCPFPLCQLLFYCYLKMYFSLTIMSSKSKIHLLSLRPLDVDIGQVIKSRRKR